MMRKITFVHAPVIRYDQNYGTLFSPLWAYTLAAHVPDGWDIVIADCKVDDVKAIGSSDVFAFSGINQDIDSIRAAYDVLKAKYPDSVFVLGGPITWSLEQEGKLSVLEYFDWLFILDGENTLPDFLTRFERGEHVALPKIIRAERFALKHARPIRFDLYRPKVDNYYGALVEVSRGCPFLCEFCDVRVLPGNNRSHNKEVGLIVEELEAYFRLGVTQFQLVCDNFIGDIVWARECLDAIIAWRRKTGAEISAYTWATVNLHKMPDLMVKMRQAGISILFIGIESVNRNSLLETAKVQNNGALEPAVSEIQSYGFIIVPGLIFGFDSDTDTVFDDTLAFFANTGLNVADPSFLTALPGTPLFARMERSGRLVERGDEVTAREKITTNIRYLQDAGFLARGFAGFIKAYIGAAQQRAIFKRHLEILAESGNYIPVGGVGYGSPMAYLKQQIRDPESRGFILRRIGFLLSRPMNIFTVVYGWFLLKRYSRRLPNLGFHFHYWIFIWTNMATKYRGLSEHDFKLHSVDADFDISGLIEASSAEIVTSPDGLKAGHQARYTNRALKALVEGRQGRKKAEETTQ